MDIASSVNQAIGLLERLELCKNEMIDKSPFHNSAALCALIFKMRNEISLFKQQFQEIREDVLYSYVAEMTENTEDTLETLSQNLDIFPSDKIQDLIEFQLSPFLAELKEELYFWGLIYPDKERAASYYKDEFVARHKNLYEEKGGLSYEITIFIPAYNKLEYTKRCMESLYRHTDFQKYKCELILLDDGSSDDTFSYFQSLGVRKTIHLKKNVRALIFSLAFRIAQGRYFAFVNNDSVLTEKWLDNLIVCMESDDRMISASPLTSNTSNLQSYPADYSTLGELDHFASSFNHSDPAKWDRRARIMPVIALYRTSALNRIGFADRLFYTMEFWDDDLSLRARRAGYYQMLCRDTYCHHYGSITGGELKSKENTIDRGKKLFEFKYGQSAWNLECCYNEKVSRQFSNLPVPEKETVRVLGIDCGFGDTLNQIGNILRAEHKTCQLRGILTSDTYRDDLAPFCTSLQVNDNLESALAALESQSCHYLYLSPSLDSYPEPLKLLAHFYRLLDGPGSCLFFHISNRFYIQKLLIHEENRTDIDLSSLLKILKDFFVDVRIDNNQVHITNIGEAVEMFFPERQNDKEFLKTISIDTYHFCCVKGR